MRCNVWASSHAMPLSAQAESLQDASLAGLRLLESSKSPEEC